MVSYDVIVIGAGLLGCFTARNLKRYDLSVALIERNADVCLEISKANTAVVYAGYDNKPGSMKAKFTVRGNNNFNRLCNELDVQFNRCGSLMTVYAEAGVEVLKKKLNYGIQNGVKGLEIINSNRIKNIESSISDSVISALYCPSTGTVNPWELCIAAYENAIQNGVNAYFNTNVLSYNHGIIKTDKGDYKTRFVIDCSGINSGKLVNSRYKIETDGADYIVLDKSCSGKPKTIIFEQSGEKCKGITVVPTIEGSLLVGPTHRPSKSFKATDSEGLNELTDSLKRLLPELEHKVIRNFAADRPNVQTDDGEDIHDFAIESRDDYFSFIGVKTPGLTCADELGKYAANICAKKLYARENVSFNSTRKNITRVHNLDYAERTELIKNNPEYGIIICRCADISKAEIREAVKRGAKDVEGVKHRVGTSMGFCQGSRCEEAIKKILEEENAPV